MEYVNTTIILVACGLMLVVQFNILMWINKAERRVIALEKTIPAWVVNMLSVKELISDIMDHLRMQEAEITALQKQLIEVRKSI